MDKLNPAVQRFAREIEVDIETKRNALERKGKDPVETEFIRGEIKSFRKVLSKINGDPETHEPDST